MQGLYFAYFYKTYCYLFLMFYIYNFFPIFMRRLHVNGESYDFILFDKALANPNYIPIYMKVNYFKVCLFKVGRLFCKVAIPKYIRVFFI